MLHTLRYDLHEVVPYINWLYFFHAWGFPSRYGDIAHVHDCPACRQSWITSHTQEEQARAAEAAKLYDHATQVLRMIDGKYHTHARVLITSAVSDGDDIVLVKDGQETARLAMLRQQTPDSDGTCWCLSDFVRPQLIEGDLYSQVGMFVSTVDRQMEELDKDDEYMHLLMQTLADRLAEATAEKAHEEVRKHLWGYAPDERLSVSEMLAEHYQGRRPAVGYPSLPDQSLNFVLAGLLHFDELDIELTESGAMRPHASTSGLMFAHPGARHFGVGRITTEQLDDYARRRGMTTDDMRRFLGSNL